MALLDRREAVLKIGLGITALSATASAAQVRAAGDAADPHRRFIAEAERMRRQAVAAGDQSYGAIIVMGDRIVGWGPSRVVADRNARAHAERVAIRDAQARHGRTDLAGAVLYSTSHPCAQCEAAAAAARVSRMYWGPQGADGGQPRPR